MAQYKIGSDLNRKLVRAIDMLSDIAQDIESRESELRNQWDDRSDSWKDSERGQEIESWLDHLQEFVAAAYEVDGFDISSLDSPSPG